MSERDIEVPWAITHSAGPCLDVGCAESGYLAHLNGPVDGIDLRLTNSTHLRNFFLGDIRDFAFSGPYRTVLAISTLEHIGLACGPYGTVEDDPAGGDRLALEACVRAGERVLVSVPFGAWRDYGWFRQYDEERLKYFTDDMNASWAIHGGVGWKQIEPEEAADWEYDHAACSARAVALITVES